ncbi:unnamed protein product [Leptidea sinapis]|uniref:SAM domain-containing protein n=1 Tax=Leptidea sinapis TaxID=189913 RepID=A0A5E4Q526_9NEOP|nr:unnamed protein product [Leptidea sinapis]
MADSYHESSHIIINFLSSREEIVSHEPEHENSGNFFLAISSSFVKVTCDGMRSHRKQKVAPHDTGLSGLSSTSSCPNMDRDLDNLGHSPVVYKSSPYILFVHKMSSLNISAWSPDQVVEWMSGLGPKVAQYSPEFQKNGVNGSKLLSLRCDDCEYLGIHIIGHQELLLEAVELLRNFHYELTRECVQQLALRVSTAAASLARSLRLHTDARLETQILADVARTVQAVKPLVCWLDRHLSLEAATCAQRDRFAEAPARAVGAAAAAAAALADHIVQDVADPAVLQPAALETMSVRGAPRGAAGFHVLATFCGHLQLAHPHSPQAAAPAPLVRYGDEIVQVGGCCVIGWSAGEVQRACERGGARGGELVLRVRRRGALPLPAPAAPSVRPQRPHSDVNRYEGEAPQPRQPAPTAAKADSSSDESEPISPPASPTTPTSRAHLDTARWDKPDTSTLIKSSKRL